MGTELDVRSWTSAERYARVLAAVEALHEGASLRVIIDHEPRALRLRLHEVYAGNYIWTQRNLDEEYWEAIIRRTAPLGGAGPREAFLHCTSLFADVATPARKTLARKALERTLEAGETVVEQGTSWPYVGLVASGSVNAMVSTQAGRDYGLFEAFPSDIFGEIQGLDAGVTIARYEAAATKTAILLLPRELLLELADRDGAFARRLATVCAQRARLLHEMLYARIAKPTITRLAAVILPYAERTKGLGKSLQPLPSMTQSQLAVAAGTVKDVVGRDLATLCVAGAVELRNGRIVAIDEERLRSFL